MTWASAYMTMCDERLFTRPLSGALLREKETSQAVSISIAGRLASGQLKRDLAVTLSMLRGVARPRLFLAEIVGAPATTSVARSCHKTLRDAVPIAQGKSPRLILASATRWMPSVWAARRRLNLNFRFWYSTESLAPSRIVQSLAITSSRDHV